MDSKAHAPPSPPPGYNQTMQSDEQQFEQNQQQQQQRQNQPSHPQHAYPMHPQMMPRTVVNEQVVSVIMTTQVGPDPQTITCPSCRATVMTRVEHEATTKTHLMAGLICVFCLWCFVCIPYCCSSCKNANHYCPSCGAFIGTYSN